MIRHTLKQLVIVGGGTAGWMTAARLARHFRKTDIRITLVESSDIGTVGVGEATIPTLRQFYADLGMTDTEVMRATQATVKLGIQFEQWHGAGRDFIHPFGVFGQKANGIDFHHYWLKLRQHGDTSELEDYSLGLQLARHHRFTPPSLQPPSELSVFDWALHFDAAAFGRLMRDYAELHGVERLDARIESVKQHPETGNIEALYLDSGNLVGGDLFIDCSGFRALLIEQTLNTGYCDWSEWLHCDRAVAVQSERFGKAPPYTVSRAQTAGWQWRIPLQTRQGNGYVYCSDQVSDDEATSTLVDHIDGPLLNDPKPFRFTAGRRRRAWNRNCIAVGLSAGFLEPLESTSIALVETAIHKIRRAFQKPWYTQADIDRFNEDTALEYERVRDFIILHYKLNGRTDSPFWERCRAMPIPDTLREKVEAFRAQGKLLRYRAEIFGPASWLAIYSGLGLLPERYHPGVDRLDFQYLKDALKAMRQSVADAVAQAPTHNDYLQSLNRTG